MAYATLTDIQNEFKSVTFGATSTPTSTAVSSFITQVEAAMNGKIGRKYQVPVTGTQSLAICQMISIMIVSQRVRNILRVKSSDKDTSQETGAGDGEKRGWKMVDDIVDGKLLLSDAVLATSKDGVDSFTNDNFGQPSTATVQPNFNVGVDQW